jgi:hypothetical protein
LQTVLSLLASWCTNIVRVVAALSLLGHTQRPLLSKNRPTQATVLINLFQSQANTMLAGQKFTAK